MRYKFKSILGEFYRDLPWVDEEYQRGDDIDWENATFYNVNMSGSSGGPTMESGTVANGDAGTVTVDHLEDGSSSEVRLAKLVSDDGTAVPTGCDLVIATFDNAGAATKQVEVLSGDGATVYDEVSGNPVASYTNNSGSGQTVGLLVDNGHFNTGSGSDVEVVAGGITEEV